MREVIEASFERLRAYCENNDFRGWDPYDGLNSRLFQAMPFMSRSRWMRIAWIQAVKRCPINLRPWVGIAKGHNPKGIALFLSGYCSLHRVSPCQETKDRIISLADRLLELRSHGWRGDAWGYDFDWQARAFFLPKGTPTIVASSYAANALLDAFDVTGDERYLQSARSCCTFILEDLHRSQDPAGNMLFSYSPLDRSVVFNAGLLGARLLSRMFAHDGAATFRDAASSVVRFCLRKQAKDGSWAYGDAPFHRWIDNFHTGFNLQCIADYRKYCSDDSVSVALRSGLRFYLERFFTPEGVSKYYHDKTYPIDIHAPAQLVVTLDALGVLQSNRALVERVLIWTIRTMQDPEGYFYFQKGKRFTSKTPFMRWAQGWMFYGLSTYRVQFGLSE